ncbi:MAG: hypothetical protein QM323_02800 [Acidobacteriota bacterium]|nr:hypothetical protein [Acidobacteriota bacterium]
MTVRVLSRDPTAFFFDGAVTVDGGETSVDVVTVTGSTIAGIGASLAGKVSEAPNDGQPRQGGAHRLRPPRRPWS